MESLLEKLGTTAPRENLNNLIVHATDGFYIDIVRVGKSTTLVGNGLVVTSQFSPHELASGVMLVSGVVSLHGIRVSLIPIWTPRPHSSCAWA